MKKIIWLLAMASFFIGCTATREPAQTSRKFKVIEIHGNQFRAQSGGLKLTFTKVMNDSIWIGKEIEVSKGK